MQCGRSKTTVIVKHLAATAKLTLSDRMRTGPFISTDGSNDVDAKKFPIVVRTFNEEPGQVCSELLAMPVCQGSASGKTYIMYYLLVSMQLFFDCLNAFFPGL